MRKVLENSYVDPFTTGCDSIVETAEVFGIAAARTKIYQEIKFQIGSAHYRHTALCVDLMTSTGVVTSVNRYGSAKREADMMLRISDASPIKVITESAIDARSDPLKGISPPIMFGMKPKIGSLYNSFHINEKFVAEHLSKIDRVLEDL